MNLIRQILSVTVINLQSIPHRLGTSLVICVGIAGVVAVLTTVLAMSTGLQSTMTNAARDDRAIVLRSGSLTEVLSMVSRSDLVAIEAAPGIRRTPDGKPAVSSEVLVSVNLPRAGDGTLAAAGVRGLTPNALAVRPEITITEGRLFAPGVHEIIVGRTAREQFAQLAIGDAATFYNSDWKVVGTFESDGDVHESELLADAEALMSAAQRNVFNAATVVLDGPEAFPSLKQALSSDPMLKVEVQTEADYYLGQSKQVSALLDLVATTVGAIMAIGALFAALNTMYSAVSARSVEIATLRALGFGAFPVVVSVLVEALLLALIGAAAGGAIAWLLFNGDAFSTGGTLRQVAIHLHVGASLIATSALWAATIGLLGALIPAIRAARISVSDGLRVV